MKDQGYSEEKQAAIGLSIEKWNKECKSLLSYKELSEADKENFDLVTGYFAENMYGYYLQEPGQWTMDALEKVLVTIFPKKLIVHDIFYESVEPALLVFFEYLKNAGIQRDYISLTYKLQSASKRMLEEIKKPNVYSPFKQILMDDLINGENLDKVNVFSVIFSNASIVPEAPEEEPYEKRYKRNEGAEVKFLSAEIINEPSLKQWALLYEMAKKIQLLDPWQQFLEESLITLRLPQSEEPLYISFMGKDRECLGIVVYSGEEGLMSYRCTMEEPFEDSMLFSGYEQKCLVCHFGNREDIMPKDREIMKKLNLRFRGRKKWIHFRTMEPGYVPWYLNENEAGLLGAVLENLLEVLKKDGRDGINVNFDDGETLLRYYETEQKRWINTVSKLPPMPVSRVTHMIEDDLLMARIKKYRYNNASLELEALYLPAPIQNHKNERPLFPQMVLLLDGETGLPLDQDIIDYLEIVEESIINMLIEYVEEWGRPIAIYVRDGRIASMIRDFCKKAAIKLTISQELPMMDHLLYNILDFMEQDD